MFLFRILSLSFTSRIYVRLTMFASPIRIILFSARGIFHLNVITIECSFSISLSLFPPLLQSDKFLQFNKSGENSPPSSVTHSTSPSIENPFQFRFSVGVEIVEKMLKCENKQHILWQTADAKWNRAYLISQQKYGED